MNTNSLIIPNWSAPAHVTAFTTTTAGGVSGGNFSQFNLGLHVNDNPVHVMRNRMILQNNVGVGRQLCWLHQTHSDIVINTSNYLPNITVEGDAAFSDTSKNACVVMTADCLPVLLCNSTGTKVAALHCGWKGLHHNIIKKTIQLHFQGEHVISWLGPAIGKASYEVDEGLYQKFIRLNNAYESAFFANKVGHYLCDLYEIARIQLMQSGVSESDVYGAEYDTFTDDRFYSYRRNHRTGRMASVIYFDKAPIPDCQKY